MTHYQKQRNELAEELFTEYIKEAHLKHETIERERVAKFCFDLADAFMKEPAMRS